MLGAGGYEDTPAIRAYMKVHKEVTGVDADYWGSVMYGSLLQVLEQAIEGVGSLDKKAITAYIKSHTFKTIVGDMDLRNQQMTRCLDRRPMAGWILPRCSRYRLHQLQAGQAQDQLVIT